MSAYGPTMSIQRLFVLFIAFAMSFSPLAIQSGGAMAMAPAADHHARMMDSDHCGEQPAKNDDRTPDDKSCCVAMCTAIAVAPVVPIEPHALASSTEQPSLVEVDHSFLAKLPTPPPRLA